MSEKIINKESLEMYENDQAKYSIIVNRRRAFPEVRDGLKPVQRRVIYAAYKDGLNSPKLRDKSASLVGETMKRYHPHGDCLDGDTVIYGLDNSFRTIKEIYESGIKYLDILAVDPNTGKVVPAKATNFRIGKTDTKEYNILFSDGALIKCTGNHPFLLSDKSWVMAKDLKTDDELYQGSLIKENGTFNYNDDIMLGNLKILNINIIKTEPKEYYDFTVDGFKNMMIPILSPVSRMSLSSLKYCPMICVHNSSIYEAIVTLTSWFKTKYPIFYGQGSWGNVSGAGAAASRYTECALSNFGYDVLIDELAQSNNIVDWLQTYKRNNDREPEFLPSKLPLVLINGTFGIGVGMAVNVPSHNIKEVIAETQKLIKNPNADVFLIPDLPQDCILIDTDWKSICDSGYGSFKVRGKIITEQDKNGNYILRIVSLPDMTNTGDIVDKILKMVEEKQLPMIKDVIDDLKDSKPNIIIQLKPGTDPSYVKQVLYAKTQVQKTMSVNFEAVDIDGINTRRFSYKDYLLTFIAQRENIKFRLYCNRLQQVLTRHHHIDAFVKVLESGEIDNIISMIKKSKGSDDEIVEYIIKKCKVTDLQAKFIINANIAKLSMRHLLEYKAERTELEKKIRLYEPYVTDDGTLIKKEIYDELTELSKKYGDERKCIVKSIDEENQIPKGTFKVVITDKNYIRKIPDTDKVNIVRKDNPKFIIRIDNSENLLIFDNKGKVFNLPVHKIPISDRTSPGTDVRILIKNLTSNIISIFSEPIFKRISELGKKHYLVVVTKSNTIKKLDIEDFLNVGPSGLIYSKVRDDDEVTGLALAAHDLDVVVNSNHKALRMRMKDISLLKRNAYGPKAMNTDESINGLSVIYPDSSDIIVLTKNGKFNRFGSPLMSTHARASKGSSCIKLDPSDEIFGIYGASESDSIRVVTSEGVEEVPVISIKSKSSIAAGQKMLTSKGVILKADIIR